MAKQRKWSSDSYMPLSADLYESPQYRYSQRNPYQFQEGHMAKLIQNEARLRGMGAMGANDWMLPGGFTQTGDFIRRQDNQRSFSPKEEEKFYKNEEKKAKKAEDRRYQAYLKRLNKVKSLRETASKYFTDSKKIDDYANHKLKFMEGGYLPDLNDPSYRNYIEVNERLRKGPREKTANELWQKEIKKHESSLRKTYSWGKIKTNANSWMAFKEEMNEPRMEMQKLTQKAYNNFINRRARELTEELLDQGPSNQSPLFQQQIADLQMQNQMMHGPQEPIIPEMTQPPQPQEKWYYKWLPQNYKNSPKFLEMFESMPKEDQDRYLKEHAKSWGLE